jgi:hypothetical protein
MIPSYNRITPDLFIRTRMDERQGGMSPRDDAPGKIVQLRSQTFSQGEMDFLPLDYKPSEKDIICGRARENFHHGKPLVNTSISKFLSHLSCINPPSLVTGKAATTIFALSYRSTSVRILQQRQRWKRAARSPRL